jgi:hypothetical protein
MRQELIAPGDLRDFTYRSRIIEELMKRGESIRGVITFQESAGSVSG